MAAGLPPLALSVIALLLHEGQPLAPHDVLGAWTLAPETAIPLTLALVLYLIGLVRMDARAGRSVGGRARMYFLAGWITLTLALVSPLHAMSSALFTAHMVQHELLMVVAAPLLVIGRPAAPWLFALPAGLRRATGRLARNRVAQALWLTVTGPLVAFILHAAAILSWHLPRLYSATLRSDPLHGAQHASFLFTALLFWSALLGHPRRARQGIAILALFGTALYTGGLGALLTLSPSPWYSDYGDAARAWGLTLLADQQLGGMVMWMPGGAAYLAAAIMFGREWLRGPRSARLAPVTG